MFFFFSIGKQTKSIFLLCCPLQGLSCYVIIRFQVLAMSMNLQDIYEERELVLIVIKVGLILPKIKLGLIFIRVKLGVANEVKEELKLQSY